MYICPLRPLGGLASAHPINVFVLHLIRREMYFQIQEWNMGQRASNTASVFFEDVVVPEEVGGF